MSASEELSPREAAFVEAYLSGGKDGKPMPAGRAYEAAGYKARGASADTLGSRMLRKVEVSRYVEKRRIEIANAEREERRKLAEAAQIQKWEVIELLGRALKTPVGDVDETSDLAQEVTTDEVGEAVIRKKVKMVDKLGAAKQLATLLNWNAPVKVEVDGMAELAELIGLVRKGGK